MKLAGCNYTISTHEEEISAFALVLLFCFMQISDNKYFILSVIIRFRQYRVITFYNHNPIDKTSADTKCWFLEY